MRAAEFRPPSLMPKQALIDTLDLGSFSPPAPKKFKRAREPEVPSSDSDDSDDNSEVQSPPPKKFKYDQSPEEMLLKIKDARRNKWKINEKGSVPDLLSKAGRFLLRKHGPFFESYDSLWVGLHMWGEDSADLLRISKTLESLNDYSPAYLQSCADTFTDLVTTVPDFKILIPYLQARASRTLILSAFLDAHARASRSDDISSLKKNVHYYINPIRLPSGDIVPTFISDGNDKSNRSWKDASLARLLVPRKERDKFDNDPYLYMRRVREGFIPITGYNYPSFMYDDSVPYRKSAMDVGLCRGYFSCSHLLKCFRNIFTGPWTANAKPGTGGKKGIAKKNSMRCVTPQNIAYIAVITRFAINS
ncbi:hypothetical protein A0H81_07435 [Grifola frondosa]|uniref:Uncharacterized protein n=1 Tax=Grifola frondosa TaxID=5627 RepID=A0A1C7MC85_GRIFR|nr:hypothetical protein A0H81_07435 [Grifola frondosa]